MNSLLLRRRMMGRQMIEVNWNQLLDGAAEKVNSSGTAWSDCAYIGVVRPNLAHKYYVPVRLKGKNDSQFSIYYNGDSPYYSDLSSSEYSRRAYIFQPNVDSVDSFILYDRQGSGEPSYMKDAAIIDLTQMFGSGNEPSTVAEFESWLTENGINPDTYITYNAGETRTMTKPSWIQ